MLEAKAEGTKFGNEEDAQAYTYAAHPEIRALYYCLSDGKVFAIYKTIAPPESPPLLLVSLDDLAVACTALKAYLSEDALRDVALKLESGPERIDTTKFDIISGHANFDSIDYHFDGPPQIQVAVQSQISGQMELLTGTIYPVKSGTFKSDDGVLKLIVELGGHTQSDIEFQKLIGIDFLEFQSIGGEISNDMNKPTIFQTRQHATLKPGDIIQSSRVAPQRLPFSVEFIISVDAFVFIEGKKLLGKFKYSTETPMPQFGNSRISVYIEGDLELNIA